MRGKKWIRGLSFFLLFALTFGLFAMGNEASALTAEAQSAMDGILKNISGAKEFTVNLPVDNGKVVDLKDYGLSESNSPADNETAFANAIAKVKSSGAWKLNIPKGTYAVALTGKEAISLSNLKNVLVEGNGSTLIFSVRTTLNNTPAYITMNNSKTVAIQNLSLDWDRSIYPIYGIGKVSAVNTTAGTVDFTFSDITIADNAIFGGGRSWDPATDNRSETKGFQFPGGSSGISSMTKLASNKLRLTYKNPTNVSSAKVGEYGQFWFRPEELVNGFRMQTNSHITFDNVHLYTVPYQAIFSNDSEYFQIINSSVEPAPGTKERFSSYGGVEVHSVDGYFRMENCHLEGINDDNLHLSNHFFGGGVSGNPKIDNYTVALDHLTHWMHYTEVYVGATFGMRDANFKDLGWTSKVKSFTWENYFTSDGNAPWRCTVTFEDPLPTNYKDTNQFWNMDKNTGNYIVRNNTFAGGLAHAMYLGLANGTVENNRVENFAYPGLILNCLIRWDRWAIGTPINNVIIRDNTLKDCNKALRDPAAMFVGGGIDEQPSDYNPVSGRIVSNVLVENNVVESTPWAAFGTFSSKNIVIRNNSFINASTTAKKSGKPGGNVFITNADNVVCTGNTVYHGAVSYETGINVDSATTTSVYSQSNHIQKYVKNNGLYGDIIVDTNTYGFEKVAGSWSNSSYAGYSATVIGSSSTGAQVRWRPLLRRGHYEVFVYKMVVGASEAADEATQIQVKHKNGTYSTTMNCHSGTKGFVSLGTFEFEEGNVGYVQATRSSSTLRVSAVKFVRKDECTHGAKESVVKATCTAKGYTQRACSTCGYTYKQDYTPALGHSYKYTNEGATHKITCSRCSYSSSVSHSYSNGSCVCGVKDTSYNLYFDFKNTATDKARYSLPVYGGYNFDQATSPYWATGANGGVTNATVDNSAGTMTVKVIADADSAGNYGPYIETTNTYGKYPWSGEAYRSYYPLAYSPSQAEYIQLRFKLSGCTAAGTSPKLIVCVDTLTGDTYKSYENLNGAIDGSSTAYQVITIPVKDKFKSVEQIKSLGFRFRDIQASTSSGGSVVIDYIFVGKRTDLPEPLYLVTFKGADGTVLATTTVSKGATASYSGATPTKASDGSKHYSFKGWDKALTNITADTVVTAQFTATAHSYSFTSTDSKNHTATCSCGYSKTEAHSYTYTATKEPTTSATGTLTGTCAKCNGTSTVTLPKLNTTDYTKSTTKAPTCTETGTDKYTWKTTTYGSFSFTVTTKAKGHTEVVEAAVAPTCTARGLTEGKHCSVCNTVLAEQLMVEALGHAVTEGKCTLCGQPYTGTLLDFTLGSRELSFRWTVNKQCTPPAFDTTGTGHAYGQISAPGGDTNTDLFIGMEAKNNKDSIQHKIYSANEIFQLRVKLDVNVTVPENSRTKVFFKTDALGDTASYSESYMVTTKESQTDAEGYYLIHIPIAETYVGQVIETIRLDFLDLIGKVAMEGSYRLDYVYIGPPCTAPTAVHAYSYQATKKPTTSASGILTGLCEHCSATTTVTLPKLNTTDYTKTTTKEPTCTATGTDKYTWKNTTYGSFYFNATTAAKGHTSVTDKAVAPTCTATGLTEGAHCSVCNAVLTAQTTVEALGHNYNNVVTAPTCTAQGYTTHTCSRCSDGYKDTYVAATGHNYTYKASKNPTTSATGTLTGTCSKKSEAKRS